MANWHKNHWTKIKAFSLTGIFFLFIWAITEQNAIAQDQQVLELTQQSVDDTSVEGAAGRLLVRFLNNTDDPTGNAFSPYWPLTTAEIRLFNFNPDYGHAQNTRDGDFEEDDLSGLPADYNPPVAIGWEFGLDEDDILKTGEYELFPEGVRNTGQPDEKFQQLNSLPGIASNNFTSTDSNDPGEGIDNEENWAALITGAFFGLSGQPLYDEAGANRIRYRLADMEIIFEQPVTNPVLHFAGLGGIWDVGFAGDLSPLDNNSNPILVDDDRNIILTDDSGFEIYYADEECTNEESFGFFWQIYDGLDTNSTPQCVEAEGFGIELELVYDENYDNSATIDFQLIDSASGNGVSMSRLSGNSNFEVGSDVAILNNDGNSMTFDNLIFNNADDPDVTDGAAHGSVLVTGQDITSLTFSIYARGSHFPEDKGFGWAGGEGWVAEDISGQFNDPENDPPILDQINWDPENDGNVEPLEYFFAEDALLLSISTEVQPDETTLTGDECFRMLSNPIAGTTFGEFLAPLWTQGATGSDHPESDQPNIFTWEAGSSSNPGWIEFTGDLDNTELEPWEGFIMSVFADDFGADPYAEFVDFTLSLTGSEHPTDQLDFTSSEGDVGGWILLGNPYKEPIDIPSMLTNSSGIENFVYIWDRNNTGGIEDDNLDDPETYGSWRVSTGSGATEITDNAIAPFQGFFVQKNAQTSTVNFSNREAIVTTGGEFYGKEAVTNTLRLEVQGESLYNYMWLEFSHEGDFNKTRGDAPALTPLSTQYAMFGSQKENGEMFTIGHFPNPSEDFEIPVGFESTRAGTFTVSATDFNVSFGSDLYFIDLYNDKSIRMDENFKYEFTSNQAAAKSNSFELSCGVMEPQNAVAESGPRFMISSQPRDSQSELPQEVALRQNYPNPFNPATQITYELPQQTEVHLVVYDMLGREVATLVEGAVEAGVHSVNFDGANLSSGVYIYRLQAGNTVRSRKLTLIK